MIDNIKIILDYLGGVNVLWLILVCLAGTQLFKFLLAAFHVNQPMAVRPVPYLIGALSAGSFIEHSTRGVMIGVACGMVSSLGYVVLTSYADREDAPAWQRKIAAFILLRSAT